MAAQTKKIMSEFYDKLSEKMEDLEKKMDSVEKWQSGLDVKVDRIETYPDRLDALNEVIEEQNKAIRANHARYLNAAEAHTARMDLLDRKITELALTVEKGFKEVTAKVDELGILCVGHDAESEKLATLPQIDGVVNKIGVDIKSTVKVCVLRSSSHFFFLGIYEI